MNLVIGTNGQCLLASVAMLIGESLEATRQILIGHLDWPDKHPFEGEWEDYPRVPSMHEVVDALWRFKRLGLVPFEYNPSCAPHIDCPSIDVWQRPREQFLNQLDFGSGLIEGVVDDRGHMVAWDGQVVLDPRGYCYSLNVSDKFDFQPTRYWLALQNR